MEITDAIAKTIVSNYFRKCPKCDSLMSAFSTMCPNLKCKTRTPFTKIMEKSYFEHFEIGECPLHGKTSVYCLHIAENSELKDLDKTCVSCCQEHLKKLLV